MGVKMNQRRSLCVICALKGEYLQWHEIRCICQRSAVSHDELRHLVHNSENGFCLGVKVYFVCSWNTARSFSRLKEETLWSPTCEVSQPKDCQGGWKLLVSCSIVVFSEIPSMQVGIPINCLVSFSRWFGGTHGQKLWGIPEPLDRLSGADKLTRQGGLATSTCLQLHMCTLTPAFLNRHLTGRKIISNNLAYHHSSQWHEVTHM